MLATEHLLKPSLLLLAFTAFQSSLDAATIILVRHAERAGGTDNSVPLSNPGHERAQLLARMLAGSGVQAIFTSEVLRTKQTAAPLGKQLGIEPTALPADQIDSLVAKLQQLAPDQVVLIVGHSNTVPAIVMKLGGFTPPIPDSEFNRMVIVHTQADGKPSVLNLHYGE